MDAAALFAGCGPLSIATTSARIAGFDRMAAAASGMALRRSELPAASTRRTRVFSAGAPELRSAARFGCVRRLRGTRGGLPAAAAACPGAMAVAAPEAVAGEEEEGEDGEGPSNPEAAGGSSLSGLLQQGKIDEALAQFEGRVAAAEATGAELGELLEALLGTGRAEDATDLFERSLAREAGRPRLSPALCAAYLDGLRRLKRAREAVEVLERLRERPPLVDRGVYAVAVALCRDLALDRESAEGERRGWLRSAEALVAEAQERGAADEFVFQPLVHAYAHSGRAAEAVGALRRCVASGAALNASFFTALISSCGRMDPPDWESGRAYWRAMGELEVAPTVMAWTALLKLALTCWEAAVREFGPELKKAGLAQTADGLARLLLAKMEGAGTPFNDFSYNTVVAHFVQEGNEPLARAWMERAQAAGMASCFLFTLMLQPLAKAGDVARAHELEAMMEAEGIEPDAAFLCQLIECYQRAEDYAAMDATVRRLLDNWERCPIDSRVLSLVFDQYGLFRRAEAKKRVEEILDGLLAGRWGGRSRLDAHAMAKAIEALGRCRDPDATARRATGTLRELGLRPTAYVLKSVYQTHCNNSRLLDGIRVIRDILSDEQLRPKRIDDRTWTLLLQRIEKWRSPEEQREAAAVALGLLSPSAPKRIFDTLRALAGPAAPSPNPAPRDAGRH